MLRWWLGGSRKDVVCFRNMALYIVSDEWYNERIDSKKGSERVMIAAAKLVQEEI